MIGGVHMKICELCGSEEKLRHHHLTYVPEKIILLCYSCHTAVHILAKISEEKRVFAVQTMLNWVETYGSHWNNGEEKYEKSQYRKDYLKEYGKRWWRAHPDSIKESNKRYYEKNKEKWRERYKKRKQEHLILP